MSRQCWSSCYILSERKRNSNKNIGSFLVRFPVELSCFFYWLGRINIWAGTLWEGTYETMVLSLSTMSESTTPACYSQDARMNVRSCQCQCRAMSAPILIMWNPARVVLVLQVAPTATTLAPTATTVVRVRSGIVVKTTTSSTAELSKAQETNQTSGCIKPHAVYRVVCVR